MPKQNLKQESVPFAVASALVRLGEHIVLARTRRGLRQVDLATKTGLAQGTVKRIEKGHPTTAISAYFTVLWTLGLEREFEQLASPERDEEGMALERAHMPKRVRLKEGLDANF